jgi:para-nitrobenzyl esterase
MRIRAVTLAATVLACAFPAGAADGRSTRVNTSTGMLEGRIEAGVRAFRGIPLAAAPVGGLRWQPPGRAAPWKGVRDASAFGPRCMQLPLFADMVFRSNG